MKEGKVGREWQEGGSVSYVAVSSLHSHLCVGISVVHRGTLSCACQREGIIRIIPEPRKEHGMFMI